MNEAASRMTALKHTIDRLALHQKLIKQRNRLEGADADSFYDALARKKQVRTKKASHDISSTFGVIDSDSAS